jgi:cytochrome c biogenesis protein CcdA
MGGGSILLGLMAGVLSTLSPCVLPLLPLVVGGAASSHKAGAALLAAGLALSFTVIGLFVATIGFAIGIDSAVFRTFSAGLLLLMGLMLVSSALQNRFALATGGIADAGNRLLDRLAPRGAAGQLLVGLLLGAVWAPCVGPTLGAASLLAAQRQDLPEVAGIMLAFGLGAALPLLLIATLSREAMLRWRGRMMRVGSGGKSLFGGVAVVTGLFILTGTDHRIETWAVANSPAWLTDLTTRY